MISIMRFIHGYARLNLYLERDLGQDTVELGLRLASTPYSGGADVLSNTFEMLHYLERFDGRACVLPFDFVPTLEGSRSIISGFLTVLLTVGPYLAVISNLGGEYMCLER